MAHEHHLQVHVGNRYHFHLLVYRVLCSFLCAYDASIFNEKQRQQVLAIDTKDDTLIKLMNNHVAELVDGLRGEKTVCDLCL